MPKSIYGYSSPKKASTNSKQKTANPKPKTKPPKKTR
jgi:hypothetical protein